MSDLLTLVRAYLPDGSGTFGLLVVGGREFCVLENPWRGNQRKVSCIPEGVYDLEMRESPRVEDITNGRHRLGWQVKDVPDRTWIMFHPGNYVRNTDGCPLIGERFSWHPTEGPMVTNSQNTFDVFMAAMAVKSLWRLDIRNNAVEYP